jgi:hypothetical protein
LNYSIKRDSGCRISNVRSVGKVISDTVVTIAPGTIIIIVAVKILPKFTASEEQEQEEEEE